MMLRYSVFPARLIALRAPLLTQLRSLTITPTLAEEAEAKVKAKSTTKPKTPKAKAKAPKKTREETAIEKLTKKIKEEKAELKTLKSKIREEKQRLGVIARDRALEERALKGHRNLNWRQFYSKAYKMTPASEEYQSRVANLSHDELTKIQNAAIDYNEKAHAFFSPSPQKRTASPFAIYVRDNYPVGGGSSRDSAQATLKNLSESWKTLPESEKEKYKAEIVDLETHNKIVNEWKQQRVKEYKQYLDFKKNYEYKE